MVDMVIVTVARVGQEMVQFGIVTSLMRKFLPTGLHNIETNQSLCYLRKVRM